MLAKHATAMRTIIGQVIQKSCYINGKSCLAYCAFGFYYCHLAASHYVIFPIEFHQSNAQLFTF
jgi:hypothetical protein